MARYSIAEWFGIPYHDMSMMKRKQMARAALKQTEPPVCPYQMGRLPCSKRGGVCSIQADSGTPVITCPKRFHEGNLLPRWLAAIVGFPESYIAAEVPFMRSPVTGRAAGRVDLVIAQNNEASAWFGLEVQAVYFSGQGMEADFRQIMNCDDHVPPKPTANRRPDWRSSSAKRLMPQLQIKGPTLRRWGTKLAVAVDRPFFMAIGGPTKRSSKDLNDGDIIWMIPQIDQGYRLTAFHWEVLSLEESCEKLLSAETIKRQEFESTLASKLNPTPLSALPLSVKK